MPPSVSSERRATRRRGRPWRAPAGLAQRLAGQVADRPEPVARPVAPGYLGQRSAAERGHHARAAVEPAGQVRKHGLLHRKRGLRLGGIGDLEHKALAADEEQKVLVALAWQRRGLGLPAVMLEGQRLGCGSVELRRLREQRLVGRQHG